VPACGTVIRSIPPRLLAPLAAAVLGAVTLSACGGAGTPSTQGSKAATTVAHTSTTSHAASTTTSRPAASTTSSPTTPAAQELGFYPFTVQGGIAQGLQVSLEATGHCTSPGVAGAVSYRCTAEPGDVHYDPCFAPPLGASGPVLCVPNPTDTDVIRFTVGTLPQAAPRTPAKPIWAMRLGNGQVCILVNANWHGRGPFACPTPATSGSVADCRAPVHANQSWSVSCQAKQDDASPFSTQHVANVWN
jgi:hypothetical protein